MSDYTGRPTAIPASISTLPPRAGPALRVYRDDSAATDGAQALVPVYVVSAAELAVIGDRGNVPVPIAVVSDGRPVRGDLAPLPVYVVNGEPPPVETRFVVDTFTDAAGTTLASHSPDIGGAWSKHAGSGSANASIDSTGARLQSDSTASSAPSYQNATPPPSADYTVRAGIVRVAAAAATQAAGVMARAVDGANTYYLAEYDNNNGAGRWRLRRVVAGAVTTLGSASATLTQDQVYSLELIVSGSSLTLKVDGATVIGPVTNGEIAGPGLVGVRLLGTNVFRLVSFEADSA